MKKFLIIAFALRLALAGTVLAQGSNPLHITCPPNRTHWVCGGSFAFVNYTAPTTTGSCSGVATITCSPPSGALFTLGTNLVTCRATNSCRESATCSFTVIVRSPLLYNGLCHSPLGLAALNVNTNDELEVSGFGTSGQDGVRIDLGESQGLRWSMRLPAGDVDGRDFLVWQRGGSPAGADVPISNMAFTFNRGRLTVTPSAASYEFKLLRRGEVVHRQSGRTGSFDIPECHHVEQEHCVGGEFAGLNPNLPYCINFLTVECDWETPSGPIRADALVVTPEDPLPPFTAITSVEIVGRSLPVLTLHTERLLMFGGREQPSIPHRALGRARLVAQDGALTLADLGASGTDGVRIELGESKGLVWRMENPPGTPEGDMEIEVLGRTAQGIEVPVRRVTHHYRNGRTSVTPAAGPYQFKLLLHGQVVFQQGGRTGDADIPECHHVEEEHCVGEEFAGLNPHLPYCLNVLTVECEWDTPAGPVRADTLVLTPEDPLPSFAAVTGVQIRGRNLRDLPVLTLREERVLKLAGSALRLTCPPSVTALTCSTNPVPVIFPPPTVAGGNCAGPATVVCVPPSASLFPPGTTTVQCTATNACGERAVCSFNVTVNRGLVFLSEIEPNNALASAQDLGQPHFIAVVGRVGVAGDVDYYRFNAGPNAKAWITVDTGGAQWLGANSRDSALTLHNAAGAAIESDDNDGSGNGADSVLESGDASAIAGAALAGGTYYLSVKAAVAGQIIAPYRLYLTITTNIIAPEVEPNNTVAMANVLVSPGLTSNVRSASLNPAGDEDWYTVTVPGPSLLHISVDGDPERDGTGTDVQVDLFRQNGVMILFSANSASGGGAVAEGFPFRLSVAGTYYIRVRGVATSGTGTYRIMTAFCDVPPSPSLAVAHRGNRLVLSWPAASESTLIQSSRDLLSWIEMNMTPTFEGDRLTVEVPPTDPHRFFLLAPSGGTMNAGYYCCDPGFQGCASVSQSNPGECDRVIVLCYESSTGSKCLENER